MADQFKRNIAFKYRVGDILLAKPILDGEKFLFVELGDKKISRTNIVGNIIDKYESEGDKKYAFFTLDDGSGQIKLKIFGDDTDKFKDITQGLTVIVVGSVRNWNNETYIQPEIIKETDPRYLLIRKLEIEKNRKETAKPIETKKEAGAIKDQILDMIKTAEEDGGIDTDQIILKLQNVSPDIINQEVHKLLEEGIIFEPRPGRLRYLG